MIAPDIIKNHGSVLPAVLAFCVALTLVFTLVANLLPQVEGEAPVEKEIDLGSLTPESFAALGESLFAGKGTCSLCHKPPPLGRAPDIQGENMVALAGQRLADERYQGEAKSTADYIIESMLAPNAYVVAGWGVAGSNDAVSPMPKVDVAPIELSAVEVDAITAYLQHKDGNEITVELPDQVAGKAAGGVAGEAGSAAAAPVASVSAPVQNAEEAVKKHGCQACHSMFGTESPVGPSLNDIGARQSGQQILENIIDPGAEIAAGFVDMMPKDFAEKMTVMELQLIVDALLASDGTGMPSAASEGAKGSQ